MITGLILSLAVFEGCTSEDGYTGSSTDADSDSNAFLTVTVESPGTADTLKAATRGGATFSETATDDLQVLIYNSEGTLTGHGYDANSSVCVYTRSGTGCKVYALVNTGNTSFCTDNAVTKESYLTNLTTPDAGSLSDLTDGNDLLMYGTETGVTIQAGSNATGQILTVTRMEARIKLNITGSGVTLTGYKIVSLPVRSYYIPRTDDDAVSPATDADWFDTGETTLSGTTATVTWYQYENRRGSRVAVNGSTGDETDYTEKDTYAPTHATCIELYGDADGTSLTYRLYPGSSAANYDIERNSTYTYNVILSSSGSMTLSNVSIASWTEVSGGDEQNL